MPLLQEYLAHKKHSPPGTLQKDIISGPAVVLGGGGFSYERGNLTVCGLLATLPVGFYASTGQPPVSSRKRSIETMMAHIVSFATDSNRNLAQRLRYPQAGPNN